MTSRPTTLGALEASGYAPRSVRQELRENLIARLRAGDTVLPGLIGYDRTVVPQVQNAILSGHDFILLGLRGQAKTRILRTLPSLLDEAVPVLEGSEVNDDPLAPISAWGRRLVEDQGEDAPVAWLPREERYAEKLATPDVTIADLIGDIDPIKAATRRLSFDSEGALHFGLLPRTHRGIVAINELPDLQARIQVGLLNILEEGDVQLRGHPVRFPLDLMLVFSANPEDYTNRGNIITPLRDRIASQILTHYPSTVAQAQQITAQEASVDRSPTTAVTVPEALAEAVEQVAFQARASEFVDQGSGVSARMSISLMENLVSNAERRAVTTGADHEVARVSDLYAALPAVTGKIELVYEGEREGVAAVSEHLVGLAIKAVFEARFPDAFAGDEETGGPYADLLAHFRAGAAVDVSDATSSADLHARLSAVPSLLSLAKAHLSPEGMGEEVAAMELVLDGLHQGSLLSKERLVDGRVYKDPFDEMAKSLER
jgi:magnesium chelatase subunit I